MLTLPALKVGQFNQEFFLLNLAAADIDRLIRFEVLGEAGVQGASTKRRASRSSAVNWAEIEGKVQTSEKAYQRPILKKKIDELAEHYVQCREFGDVPAIPGAVLLTTDERVEFEAQSTNPFVGLVRISGDEGTLRVLDGQHRMLALAALLRGSSLDEEGVRAARMIQVPAILFPGLAAPCIVEMFVTINSKHTRLNPSLLFSLKGRQLYADPVDARIHDVIRRLNEAESSPLLRQIKMLGVGPGRVAQAGLAQEIRRVLRALESAQQNSAWFPDFLAHLDRFYLAYFKEVARVFDEAWDSKKHSIQSLIALRAFIQVSEPVAVRVMAAGGDPRATIRALVEPWRDQPGSRRFETLGEWRNNGGGGSKQTTKQLARELAQHLRGPE